MSSLWNGINLRLQQRICLIHSFALTLYDSIRLECISLPKQDLSNSRQVIQLKYLHVKFGKPKLYHVKFETP